MIKRAYSVELFYEKEEELKKCMDVAKKLGGYCSFELSILIDGNLKHLAKAIFDNKEDSDKFESMIGIE